MKKVLFIVLSALSATAIGSVIYCLVTGVRPVKVADYMDPDDEFILF